MREAMEQFTGTRYLLTAAAVVVVVWGVKEAADIVTPVLLAVFISVVCSPLLTWLQVRKLPFPLALVVVLLSLIVAAGGISFLVGNSVRDLLNNLDAYRDRFQEIETTLRDWVDERGASRFGVDLSYDNLFESFDLQYAIGLFRNLLTNLLQASGQALIIFILTAFMLTEGAWFPAKLRSALGPSAGVHQQVSQIAANIRRYIALKTLVSFVTGALVTVALAILDVSYPVLWGALALLFNFIPNVGSILAGLPAVLLALAEKGLWTAFYAAIAYLVINQAIGNLLEPRLQGRGLGLSPLVVIISLLFWGWVLGPIGMFLSAPLTMAVKIALEGHPDLRWAAVLLGGNPYITVLEKKPVAASNSSRAAALKKRKNRSTPKKQRTASKK